jgi:oligopeptide/dipeptide ABC transporter ATP-binding protein
MLFITHDLATLAEIAERVAVMYLGSIVEVANVDTIFYDPKHPYTQVLLKALPTREKSVDEVKPLPGPIPDPINPPSGCKFHPRCSFTLPICQNTSPKITKMDGGNLVACHLYGGKPNEE